MTKFADINISTALGGRTVTLSSGLLGWAGHNLVLNSTTLVTQDVTTASADYTIAFTGTGTVTISGTSTAGPIVGTGVNNLVSLEVSTTAGTLTLTVSGSVTLARVYRSDLAGMQTNDTFDPTYYPTTGSAYYAPAFGFGPVTLAALGVRIEPAATNLLTYSNDFTNAVWAKTNVTITSNAATSPDGNATADDILQTATNSNTLQSVTIAADTPHTFSVYLHSGLTGTTGWVQINYREVAGNGLNAWVNVATKTLGTSGTFGSGVTLIGSTFTDVGNGWLRFDLTGTLSSGVTTGQGHTYAVNANGSNTRDQTNSFLIYGAQLEASTVATSYIPALASTVTRTTDDLSMTTGLIPFVGYNQAQVSGKLAVTPLANGALRYVDFSDTTANEVIEISQDASNNVILTVTDGGVVQASIDSGVNAVIGTELIIGYRAGANYFAISVNGAAAVVDTSGTMPTVTEHQIGEHCLVKLDVAYDALLTDAQLVGLSA